MSTYMTGPAVDQFNPMLERARKIIQTAIVEHCGGADLERVSAVAAKNILGEIAQEAVHRHTGLKPGPWKRMPPELRAAIQHATGPAA